MSRDIDKIRKQWNEDSDTWYKRYRTEEKIQRIIDEPESAFHKVTLSIIKESFSELKGKRILVPSSGDNHAVFAFCLMGAKVTSCDISERQLENAAHIAKEKGWDIEFICDDTMSLYKIRSNEYDFVYTSNGVHVWINDLNSMYNNIHRVLKKNGVYIMYDIHPFTRPFECYASSLIIKKPYDSTGPFGEIPNYHWRIQDLINAISQAGLSIKEIQEMYAEYGTYWFEESGERESMTEDELKDLYDWRKNPLAAIPQWISVKVIK